MRARTAHRERSPGGLFWKVFFACWSTALLTGVGVQLIARAFPSAIQLPPTPPAMSQTVGVPMFTGALIALGLSALIAWSLSRPIRLLRLAFSDAASGRLDTRVAPRLGGQRDEFADLARDYDRMAAQLQALLGSQRRLLHDVSHELRSPMTRLQVAVGLLRRSPEGFETALARIEREVERLDALVGEVLTLARLESGAPQAEPAEVDIVELLASVAGDAAFEAGAYGQRLQFTTSQPGLLMVCNGELLLRAFENVIRNALKYSSAGSEVVVRAEMRGAAGPWCITVSDRGPGLPPDALARMFEPFVRVDESAGVSGFGLGLAIARRAVEAHHGCISAAAREGGGLVLTMELPLSHQRAAPIEELTRFNANARCNPADPRHRSAEHQAALERA